MRGPIADVCFWVVIKSEMTGTNTRSGGLKPSEGSNSRCMFLGCHKIRIDWYKHQQRGVCSPLRGPIADLWFWVVRTSELTDTNTSSGGLKPSEGTNNRFMVLGFHKIRID